MKTWIQENVRRLQDGMRGLFSGFIITNSDVGIAMVILVTAAFLAVIAYAIGIK